MKENTKWRKNQNIIGIFSLLKIFNKSKLIFSMEFLKHIEQ